ncbi:MAG TPA: acyltransferase [Segetibacter sp.]|jgi:fucose 4-O-acetylase-like acetyltransferase
MSKEVNTRLNWIDYARGIAIILVVYRHLFESLKNTKALKAAGVDINSYLYLEQANIFFFSFRMPLFFIVSGLFIGSSLVKRGFGELVGNKARTILYPYFLWGFIQITIQIIFAVYTNSDKSATDYTYLFYAPREVDQFWYLFALFNVTVLYAFLKSRFNLHIAYQIAIGLTLFGLSTLFSQAKIEFGFVSDIFHYYIFLALGDGLSQSMLKGSLRRFFTSWKSFGILLIPFILLQYYFLTVNLSHKDISPKFLFVEYYQPVMYLLIALVGCGFVISISSLMERYNFGVWLQKLGQHSLYIYVMHVIVFASLRYILTKFFHIYDVNLIMLICIATALTIPVAFYKVASKLGLKFLFTLEKKNKSKEKIQHKEVTNLQPVYER